MAEPLTPPPDGAPSPDPAPAGPPARVPGLGDFFWVGTACAISVVGAGAAGYGLDSWLGTTPWLTFVGLAFGVASAVLLGWQQLRKFT